jgi:DMSO reductase anchor subunit
LGRQAPIALADGLVPNSLEKRTIAVSIVVLTDRADRMHPAYSVILFTIASGAGYGLTILLTTFSLFNLVPISGGLGLTGMASALALVVIGLLSSTAHLGHPERVWRALSQWRSSWLSREGIAAIATLAPIMLTAAGWVFFGELSGIFAISAVAADLLALLTI